MSIADLLNQKCNIIDPATGATSNSDVPCRLNITGATFSGGMDSPRSEYEAKLYLLTSPAVPEGSIVEVAGATWLAVANVPRNDPAGDHDHQEVHLHSRTGLTTKA